MPHSLNFEHWFKHAVNLRVIFAGGEIRDNRMKLSKILRRIVCLPGDTRGGLAVITAMVAPALLGVMAVATDYVVMTKVSATMQTAADAAALAGAKEISLAGATDSQVKAVATAFALANLTSSDDGKSAAEMEAKGDGAGENIPADTTIDVTVNRKTGTVEVAVKKIWRPFFLHLMSPGVTPVRNTAKARTLGSGLTCVLGLSESVPSGISLWKNASLTADGCSVYSNTATPVGMTIGDDATLKAKLICSAGGYQSSSSRSVDPVPTTDCPKYEDPLASRTMPKVGSCTYPLPTIIFNQVKTLDPGVYCGGLMILGNSKVTLNKGIDTINNGLLQVSGTATMTGENVGFYLAGLATMFTFDANTTIDLTAPKDGPMAGLLFFEDRTAPPLRIHRIGSNNARRLIGTIYLPVGTLLIDASAPVADNSAYTALIVRSLQLREGPKLVLHSDYEATDIPVPKGLIGGRVMLSQ